MIIEGNQKELDAMKEFHKGNRKEGLRLQEEFAAEFREEYKAKDHCPCKKACRYHGNCVGAWFGNVLDPSQYRGLNATAFLETDFPEDAAGIRWLKENIGGSPVVLEANGDSYTEYERVSAMTGLPTILGWYVHEWLWRNDVSDLNAKAADVEAIYTSGDQAQTEALLEDYDVSYIFVGSCERSKYGESLNHDMLKSMGEIVFQDETYETYIVRVDKS